MTYHATSKSGNHGRYVGTTKAAPPTSDPGVTSARFLNGTGDRIIGPEGSPLNEFAVGLTFWRASTTATPDDLGSQRLFTQYSHADEKTRIAVALNRGFLAVVVEIRDNVSGRISLRAIETRVAILDTNRHRVMLWVKNTAFPQEYVLILDGKEVWHYRPDFAGNAFNVLPPPSPVPLVFGSDSGVRNFHGYLGEITTFILPAMPDPLIWSQYRDAVSAGVPYRAWRGSPFLYFAQLSETVTTPWIAEAWLDSDQCYKTRVSENTDRPTARVALAAPFQATSAYPEEVVEFAFYGTWGTNLAQLAVGCTKAPAGSFTTQGLGTNDDSFCYLPNGALHRNNGVVAGDLPSWGMTDIIGMKATATHIIFTKNGIEVYTYAPGAGPWYAAVRYGNNQVEAHTGTRRYIYAPQSSTGVPWRALSGLTTEFRLSKAAPVLATLQDVGTTIFNTPNNANIGAYTSPATSNNSATGDPYDTSRTVGGGITINSGTYTVASATGFCFMVAFSPAAGDLTGTKTLLRCGTSWTLKLVNGGLQGQVGAVTVSTPANIFEAGGHYLAELTRTPQGKLLLRVNGAGVAQSVSNTTLQTATLVNVGSAGGSENMAGLLSHVLLSPAAVTPWKLQRIWNSSPWDAPDIFALTGELVADAGVFTGALDIYGGTAPYSVSVTSGSAPPGITFVVSGNQVISTGTATADGNYTFTVTVTDATSATRSVPMSHTMPLYWSPSVLAVAPKIWLDDSSAVTVVGSNAAQWNSLVSGNHFSQDGFPQRPNIQNAFLNGKRVLRFDGVDDAMCSGVIGARNIGRNSPVMWAFMVHRLNSTPANTTIPAVLAAITNSAGVSRFTPVIQYSGTTPHLVVHAIRDGGGTASPSPLWVTIASPDAWYMHFVGVNYITGAATVITNGFTPLVMTGWLTGAGAAIEDVASARSPAILGYPQNNNLSSPVTSNTCPTDLAAIFVGDTAMPSSTEIDKLFGWAAHRYNLISLLPPGHPYKTTPPTL